MSRYYRRHIGRTGESYWLGLGLIATMGIAAYILSTVRTNILLVWKEMLL